LFLLAKPDNWEANVEHIIANSDKEGRDAVRKAFNELVEAGYVIRDKKRDNGMLKVYDYTVYDTVYGKPVNGKPGDGKPVNQKPDTNKTNSNKTKEIRLTTNVVEPKAHGNEEINLIVKSFEEAFGIEQGRGERRAAQWLRSKGSPDQLRALFQATAKAQAEDKYCPRTPTITKFYYKLADLQDYFKRRQQTSELTEITF
jgi:hypothetical protein